MLILNYFIHILHGRFVKLITMALLFRKENKHKHLITETLIYFQIQNCKLLKIPILHNMLGKYIEITFQNILFCFLIENRKAGIGYWGSTGSGNRAS